MHWFSAGVAILVALAIIGLGLMYLFNPQAVMPSFGLPLPGSDPDGDGWYRLKGVRDIASGGVVLGMMGWAGWRAVGIALLVEALIPLGDMSLILAAKGSTARALGIHGLTAVLMIAAAFPLLFADF